MPGSVRFEKRGRVGYVTLDRPQALNAFNDELLRDMLAIWEEFEADGDLWVAVLSGEGRAFCAGADVKAGGFLASDRYVSSLAFGPLEVSKPIIAAVHGYTLGEGFTTALACDIRIAADDTRLGYPHASHGFMTIGGNVRLPRMTFPGWAKYMVLVGETLTAEDAFRLGLVHKVVARAELMERADELAQKVLRNSPLALRYSKEVQERGLRMPFPEAVAYARRMAQRYAGTEDMREGVRAFQEKREPTWVGR
ncbi:MAG: enoyl-CoA hydratase/isomerase family protein [Chloroflexi bacterium]|nr:enoyl-CoA hydratase/isomerase family protein [Chloroflexota bacterium]